MQGLDRSTIELERSPRRGGWRTREGRRSPTASVVSATAASAPVATVVEVAEPREPSVIPVAYEPPTECTCVDGWCDLDHANE